MSIRQRYLLSLVEIILLLLITTECLISSSSNHEENPQNFGGVVSSATPEATSAGIEILQAGGNAIDAAVAVSFALAVTEPAMSGLGGGTQVIMQVPNKAPIVINGTSFSPRATPTTAQKKDIKAHRATTIPSTVRTLDFAWRHYGSGKISWRQLLAPAIRYARDGFKIGKFRYKVLIRSHDVLRAQPSMQALFLNEDGSLPEAESPWKQPVLAATLERLAQQGAEDFYSGGIARDIADDMAENGGWITFEDLKNFPEPKVLSPIKSSYRGWDVYSLTPPGGGWVVLQILNLLENFDLNGLKVESPERLKSVATALRIGHLNRRKEPVTDLLNFEKEVQEKIDKKKAKHLHSQKQLTPSGETTHFSVVDASGTVVGVTASLNAYYGARVASPKLGFVYNDYMHEFKVGKPGHPFALRPNAMPYSSMSPTILAKNGKPRLVVGSPGSSRIISAVSQVIQLWVDSGLSITEAVAAQRLHVKPRNRLYVEFQALPDSTIGMLTELGFNIVEPGRELANGNLNPYFGGVHAIAYENGNWVGAADPRRDGVVLTAKIIH